MPPLTRSFVLIPRLTDAERERHIRSMINSAITERDWLKALALIDRPRRVDFLRRHARRMSATAYWQALRFVWLDAEGLARCVGDRAIRKLWTGCCVHAARGRWRSMEPAERHALAGLRGSPVQVYRGHSGAAGATGWSWTLDRERALWFAHRFGEMYGPPSLTVASVDSAAILVILDEREERELVIDPNHLTSRETSALGRLSQWAASTIA